MNRFAKRIPCIPILLTTLLLSCTEKKEEMDPWENEMAKQLKAENIQLSHFSTRKTVNGAPARGESYLQLDIFNSQVLAKIDHNKRLMTNKCDEIKSSVLSLPQIASFAFNDLRLNVIATREVFFFKSQKTNTITYKIH